MTKLKLERVKWRWIMEKEEVRKEIEERKQKLKEKGGGWHKHIRELRDMIGHSDYFTFIEQLGLVNKFEDWCKENIENKY